MGYCTVSDVRLLVKTSLTDSEITSLIDLADAQINDIESDNSHTFSTSKKRRLSMRMTAILVAAREPEAAGAGDYGGFARDQITVWQRDIHKLLQEELEPGFIIASDE